MIYTKYHKDSGTIMGYREVYSPPIDTITFGFYEGKIDENEYYIENGVVTPRVLVTGLSVSKTKMLANGTDVAVFSGLPYDCWILVGTTPTNVVGGTLNYTTNQLGGNLFKMIGKYYTNQNLTIIGVTEMEIASGANVNWQAIEDATSAQISNWIDSNVTDLASARSLLKTIVLALRVLHDRTKG